MSTSNKEYDWHRRQQYELRKKGKGSKGNNKEKYVPDVTRNENGGSP